jgi:alkylated DNA repair protein alkB family protein 1
MIPNVLPIRTQKLLLSRLLHRDLSNNEHLTNIHFHHELPYNSDHSSFFSIPADAPARCVPKDSSTHKDISISNMLQRKLRWVTLGGQYDWTIKRYPNEKPPGFPTDVEKLLRDIFPETLPEAAIVNIYTPGDTLSMHRDVSEDSSKPLISISIGCDSIFVVGVGFSTDGTEIPPLVVRLRSGDAVLMSASSRFAWHGVPKIIPNTCPPSLENWPADEIDDHATKYAHWKGWLKNKRINLNVRQMYD